MKYICSNCKFIGKGNKKFGSFLIGGWLIGISLVYLQSDLDVSLTYGISMFVIFTLIGLLFIRNFYLKGNLCPICKNKTMFSIDDPKGKKIIEDNLLKIEDTVTNSCSKCEHRGIPARTISFRWSIVTFVAGLISLVIGIENGPIGILGSLIIIGFGIYGITKKNSNISCPNCKKNSFLPIEPQKQTQI